MKLKLLFLLSILSMLFALISPMEIKAQTITNTSNSTKTGVQVMCDNAGVQWAVYYDGISTVPLKYINFATTLAGTPAFPLYDCGVQRNIITYDAFFEVLTNSSKTYATNTYSSISITTLSGNAIINGASFPAAQTLPTNVTAALSCPQNSDGKIYALNAVTVDCTGAANSAIVALTKITP